MDQSRIVTRFAPSPTGYLHIGGARTALFNWAFARRHPRNGTFILRIEDTDRARSTPEATRRIIDDLQWLGIEWDQGPDAHALDVYAPAGQRGQRGPYFQSQRDTLYREYLQRLLDAGRAYPDGGAYRFKMPGTAITVHDLVLGDVTRQPGDLEDFVIVKSDGAGGGGGGGPTFHFANVVDDATMGVTHVLRAQEHLNNTHKHVAMFEALGIAPPQYAHMPLIFNPDGTKMSKRDKAKVARAAGIRWMEQNDPQDISALAEAANLETEQLNAFLAKETDDVQIAIALAAGLGLTLPEIDVHDFRVSGYLPQVLLNYIALLGWSPKGNVERFSLEFLRENFDLAGIGKSNARFDRAKLLAFNAEALQKMPAEEFRWRLTAHLQQFHGDFVQKLDESALALFAEAYRPRARTLDEPAHLGRFFVLADDAIEFDPKAVEKALKKNDGAGLTALRELQAVLQPLTPWEPQTLHAALEQFARQTGRGMGEVAQPLRVAVTGTTVSPAIQDTLAILGKDATLRRIERCVATLS